MNSDGIIVAMIIVSMYGQIVILLSLRKYFKDLEKYIDRCLMTSIGNQLEISKNLVNQIDNINTREVCDD